MTSTDDRLDACIEACLACHRTCLTMAMQHCLERGGEHVAPDHFRLMIACAEICASAARFMMIGTPHHRHVCAECAEICAECAEACARMDGMAPCAEACRRCAEACRRMAA